VALCTGVFVPFVKGVTDVTGVAQSTPLESMLVVIMWKEE
jgi:hypothetical protein